MIWIGLAIVVVTFYLIYKNYEARLVLALSGLVMAFIGQVVVGTNGGVSAAVDAFVKQLVNGGLVPTIVTVMGFGYVMTFTKCSDHLVNLLVKPLARVPVIVIPGAVIITWLLNIVLPSAAGIAAAVGVLLIPALIALKVRPVMAAAAVFIGTWGSVVSPGLMFNPQIADIAFKAKEIPAPDAMIVIMQEALPCAIGALVAAICLTIICIVLKEGVGSTEIVKELPEGEEIQKAFVGRTPTCLEARTSNASGIIGMMALIGLTLKSFSVPVCMLIGTAIGLIVALVNKQKIGDASKKFCRGAGDGFCDVVILIAAAAMFASGMKAIGLTSALVDAMKGSQSVAMFAAAAGPFVMAAISGSGNAAALAFNQAITPNAADFGLTIVQLGAVAQIAAGLGRSMSPVAGGVIILAGIAGVNPMEVVKRTAIPAIVALIVVTLLMFAMS